jgi:hypothetical protein
MKVLIFYATICILQTKSSLCFSQDQMKKPSAYCKLTILLKRVKSFLTNVRNSLVRAGACWEKSCDFKEEFLKLSGIHLRDMESTG